MIRTTIGAVALAAVTTSVSAQNLVAIFDLIDHPDGALNPPPYGLRVDNLLGSGQATLSIGTFSDTQLRVFEDEGDISIQISGTLFGGVVDGSGGYESPESYEVDFTYAANVTADGGGWLVTDTNPSNTGTLTRTSTGEVIQLYSTPNIGETFVFRPDGHRLAGDSTSFVGRGWLTDQSDGSDPLGGTRDWLFIGIEREVPAPGSVALLALGGLVGSRRRR